MNEELHVKDWYVARVVVLENENRRLANEVSEQRQRIIRTSYSVPAAFLVGYFLCCILWRVFK